MGKFSTARWVEAPHRAEAGTVMGPIESFSVRVASGMARLRGSGCTKSVRGVWRGGKIVRAIEPPSTRECGNSVHQLARATGVDAAVICLLIRYRSYRVPILLGIGRTRIHIYVVKC